MKKHTARPRVSYFDKAVPAYMALGRARVAELTRQSSRAAVNHLRQEWELEEQDLECVLGGVALAARAGISSFELDAWLERSATFVDEPAPTPALARVLDSPEIGRLIRAEEARLRRPTLTTILTR